MANTVSNAVGEVLDHFAEFPPSVDRPGALIAGVAVGAIVSVGAGIIHRGSKEVHTIDVVNRKMVETSVQAVDSHKPVWNKVSRYSYRLGPGAIAWMSGCVAASSLFAGMHYDVPRANSDARLAVVLDSSSSVRYTADLDNEGTTRYQAAINALENMDFPGQVAIIETAETSKQRIPMSADWREQLEAVRTPQVEANGGALTEGIQEALDTLPNVQTENGERQTTGTMLVFSDGRNQSTDQQIQNMAAQLAENNVDEHIIVVGTPDGTYTPEFSTQIVEAPTLPEALRPLSENISEVATMADIESVIQDLAYEAGTTDTEKPWYGGVAVAGLVWAAAELTNLWQRARKIA